MSAPSVTSQRSRAPSHRATRSTDVTRQHRLDIQALRAVAVLGVVTYHLFPHLLRGGFVGVDVFFVISGFLITSHLLSSTPSRPADFARFWSRRALRLLPPVVVVILTTLVGVVLFMSAGQWKQMAREAVTSMLYVQNWQLIGDATDYLDAHRAVSPFQHFWSLSVEEQYYLAWPFLVAGLAWLAVRLGRSPRAVIGAGFAVAVTASFVWGLVRTHGAPAEAYFSTFTRMWELGIGSLLAAVFPVLVGQLTVRARILLWWLGVLGIVAAYLVISSATPFPGYAAALPTLATAAVILAADPPHPTNPRRAVHAAPVQLVGDCSYALYLWHWPVIVLAPYALGRDLSVVDKLGLLVVALVLAWASTTFLEGPVRGSAWLRARLRRVFGLSAVITVVVIAASIAVTAETDHQIASASADVDRAITAGKPCFGAAAMDVRQDCSATQKLVTTPAFAKDDYSDGITDEKCLNWPPFHDQPVVCRRGDTSAPTKRIALFGNSHAGQWVEAMSQIGTQRHWELDTYLVGDCYSTFTPDPSSCDAIMKATARKLLAGHYDLVVLSTLDRAASSSADMYAPTIEQARRSGARVLVIRDTPSPGDPANVTPDCVAAHPGDVGACAGRARSWLGVDYLTAAAKQLAPEDPGISWVDLNKYLCQHGSCPAVIGGVIPYRDESHLTVTYTLTLVPYLEPAVAAALGPSA